jgi:dihydroorotase
MLVLLTYIIFCCLLYLKKTALLVGGIKPHYYCLPILKRETHRQALIGAATSGSSKFFLGTDSAPHDRAAKESCCGCAGCFTAHGAVELYAEVFESMGALDKLEAFCSIIGADFYGLERNNTTLTLEKKSWTVPQSYPFGQDGVVVPLRAGETISWSIVK